jgi:hypothetical protein
MLNIVSLQGKLSLLEQQRIEISEMRKRLEQKEQEINETISQTKSMLSLLKTKEEVDKEESQHFDHLETSNSLLSVADLTLKQSKEFLISKRLADQKNLENVLSEHSRVLEEITHCEQEIRTFNALSEGGRNRLERFEVENTLLNVTKALLEKECSDLSLKYCEMSLTLLGQSFEESSLVLHSIRESPNVPQMSPFLQKFAAVVNDLKKINDDMDDMPKHLNTFGIICHQQEDIKLKEKLKSYHDQCHLLETQVKELKNDIAECDSKIGIFDTPSLCDKLVAAMKWSILESGGLYQPRVDTAPLALLLFDLSQHQSIDKDQEKSFTKFGPSNKLIPSKPFKEIFGKQAPLSHLKPPVQPSSEASPTFGVFGPSSSASPTFGGFGSSSSASPTFSVFGPSSSASPKFGGFGSSSSATPGTRKSGGRQSRGGRRPKRKW